MLEVVGQEDGIREIPCSPNISVFHWSGSSNHAILNWLSLCTKSMDVRLLAGSLDPQGHTPLFSLSQGDG